MQSYFKVLPNAQKLFSLKTGFRNGFHTALYHLLPQALPESEKVTLFTCNIFPPNVVVWNHLVRKHYGNKVDVYIFDCSGFLNKTLVPGAKVQKYMNAMHPTKIDVFMNNAAKKRQTVWICDDDVFPTTPEGLAIVQREFQKPNTATVSLRPRTWWHFEIDGKEYLPSGSYCIALNTEMFKKEHLNAQPADNNNHPRHIKTSSTRYDTLDKSNEILIKKGYRCAIVDEQERDACMCGFDGTSIAALLLDYFKSSEDTLKYFTDPEESQWEKNELPRNLNALLAAWEVAEMYEQITGKEYVMRSMPAKEQLQEIAKRATPYLTHGRNFTDVYKRSATIRDAL